MTLAPEIDFCNWNSDAGPITPGASFYRLVDADGRPVRDKVMWADSLMGAYCRMKLNAAGRPYLDRATRLVAHEVVQADIRIVVRLEVAASD